MRATPGDVRRLTAEVPLWTMKTVDDNRVSLITLAIPFFFLLIGVELLVARLQKRDVYRVNDSINDLSCGVIQQITGVFLIGLISVGYLYLYEHHRIFTISESSALSWGAALIGVDFCYSGFIARVTAWPFCGPPTSCTIKAKSTTSPSRSGRPRFSPLFRGCSIYRSRCSGFLR